MAKEEEIPQTNSEEIEDLIEQIRGTNLEPGVKAKIERLLRTILNLVALLQRKNISIAKLRKLIFGQRTEKRRASRVEQGEKAEGASDTWVRILSCLKEDQDEKGRITQTSGIVVKTGERRIALYFTGRRHAGENLAGLLKRRSQEWGRPFQMSDALGGQQQWRE
jgi:hypothetical protein